MIDFTQYEYDAEWHSVALRAPRSKPRGCPTTLADSGVVFFHRIIEGVLQEGWIDVEFASIGVGRKIVLQTYYLGYIGI